MNVPEKLLYTKEHEWVKIDGHKAKMGITDHAQSSLGDITFVELPEKGTGCTQFKQVATVESVKAASDVYAPMSGKVIEINEDIVSRPELVNNSPYEKGWFIVLEMSDEKEKDNLMSAAEYKEYLEEVAH